MIYPIVLVACLLLCFWRWFFPGYISSGDLWPMAEHAIRSFSLWPSAWGSVYGGGLGASSIPYLWNHFQYGLPIFLFGKVFGLSWEYIVRFGYLFPFLLLSIFSSYHLANSYIKRPWSLLASVIYTVNTYSILIISGGQTGVAMAYALSPLVLQQCTQTNTGNGVFRGIRNGLWLSLLVAMDLRLAYLVFGAIVLFYLIQFITDKANVTLNLFSLAVSCIVVCSIHAFWIVPSVLYRGAVTEVGEVFTNPGMLKFLSFADFSHAVSLLHPNWPENLFGKVYFLQPEFLFIPILAFCSMFFASQAKNKKHVVFFGLLALLGSFFAKGVTDPFGGIFNWCFGHIPGFVMFRDPTKFYLYIALAYAVLIPLTLSFVVDVCMKVFHGKNKKIQGIIPVVLYILFVGFWMFAMRDAVTGKIGGTLHTVVVPNEYQQFELQQSKDPESFFRTFWIPSVHRFAYPTSARPALDALTVTGSASASGIINWVQSASAQTQLAKWSVAYVVVPIDTDGTQFTTERVYDEAKRNEIIGALDEIPWLKRDHEYTDLAVWKMTDGMGHVWKNIDEPVSVVQKTQTQYEIVEQSFETGDRIVFSESYSPLWVATFGSMKITSTKTDDGLNQFILPQSYAGAVVITYTVQQSVQWGLWIGVISFVGYCIVLLYEKKHS